MNGIIQPEPSTALLEAHVKERRRRSIGFAQVIGMESYREIIEKAKKLEAVVNSFGSDIHLQRAIELVARR